MATGEAAGQGRQAGVRGLLWSGGRGSVRRGHAGRVARCRQLSVGCLPSTSHGWADWPRAGLGRRTPDRSGLADHISRRRLTGLHRPADEQHG